MNSFRYQAIEAGGANVSGVIQADDRKSALQLLGQKNLFPSLLETISSGENSAEKSGAAKKAEAHFGRRIKRKDITAFTREISALLAAAIPIWISPPNFRPTKLFPATTEINFSDRAVAARTCGRPPG